MGQPDFLQQRCSGVSFVIALMQEIEERERERALLMAYRNFTPVFFSSTFKMKSFQFSLSFHNETNSLRGRVALTTIIIVFAYSWNIMDNVRRPLQLLSAPISLVKRENTLNALTNDNQTSLLFVIISNLKL